MTQPVEINFTEVALDKLADHKGRVALIMTDASKLPGKLPRVIRDAATRALASKAGRALKSGQALELSFPAGMAADALILVMLPNSATQAEARRAGAALGAKLGTGHTLVLAGSHKQAGQIAFGLALRGYDFSVYKTKPATPDAAPARPNAPAPARVGEAVA